MNRPAIPEPPKREARRECFFGCIICCCPVFQYDHIVEHAQVQEHTLENLALLCEMHHGTKSTGNLSRDFVAEARRQPFNASRQFTSMLLRRPNRPPNPSLCRAPSPRLSSHKIVSAKAPRQSGGYHHRMRKKLAANSHQP
jgi:hypothetical protein